MSDLLLDVRDHLHASGFLDGLSVQFWRWTDNPGVATLVIRRAGTSGGSDHIVQRPDVRLIYVTAGQTSAEIRAAEVAMSEVLRWLYTNYHSPGIIHYEPLTGTAIGPMFLEDGRAAFELNVRCLVDEAAQAAAINNRIIDYSMNEE